MRALSLMSWLLFSLLFIASGVLQADDFSGTYVIQGIKGAITLTLQQDEEGSTTGSLKGGDLALQLEGIPTDDGGIMGKANDAQGKFASFFIVTKQGDKLILNLVPANDNGEPDATKVSQIPFPLIGASKTHVTPPADDDNDEEAPATATQTTKGSFAGTFKSPELTLESKAAGDDYTGTIKIGRPDIPVHGNGSEWHPARHLHQRQRSLRFSGFAAGQQDDAHNRRYGVLPAKAGRCSGTKSVEQVTACEPIS